jgi:hypothetical protein
MGVQTSDGSAPGGASFKAGVLSDGATPATVFTSLLLCSANLPDKIAISVDAQTDDGDGKKGNVRAAKQDSPNPPPWLPRQASIRKTASARTSSAVKCRFVRLPQPVLGCGQRLRRAEQHDHIAGLQRSG